MTIKMPVIKSSPSDESYRAAARRLYPPPAEEGLENSVHQWSAVQRVVGEGAYVDVTVFVPLAEAEKEGSYIRIDVSRTLHNESEHAKHSCACGAVSTHCLGGVWICCVCFVQRGMPPADWHPICMEEYAKRTV